MLYEFCSNYAKKKLFYLIKNIIKSWTWLKTNLYGTKKKKEMQMNRNPSTSDKYS